MTRVCWSGLLVLLSGWAAKPGQARGPVPDALIADWELDPSGVSTGDSWLDRHRDGVPAVAPGNDDMARPIAHSGEGRGSEVPEPAQRSSEVAPFAGGEASLSERVVPGERNPETTRSNEVLRCSAERARGPLLVRTAGPRAACGDDASGAETSPSKRHGSAFGSSLSPSRGPLLAPRCRVASRSRSSATLRPPRAGAGGSRVTGFHDRSPSAEEDPPCPATC